METRTTTTASSSVVVNGPSVVSNTNSSTLKTKINKIFKATNESSSSSNDDDMMSRQQQHQMQQQQHLVHTQQRHAPYQNYQLQPGQPQYVNNNYMHRNLNQNDLSAYTSNLHGHHQFNIAPEEEDVRYDDEYDPNLNDYDPGVRK